MYYSNSSFTVALLVLLTEDIVRQAVKLCMIINPQTIIFSMLKNLGTMGSKNWVALYLQMQLKSKYIYNSPRAQPCGHAWRVQVLTIECMHVFNPHAVDVVTALTMHLESQPKEGVGSLYTFFCMLSMVCSVKSNMMVQSNNQEPFCKQSSSKMMVKIS